MTAPVRAGAPPAVLDAAARALGLPSPAALTVDHVLSGPRFQRVRLAYAAAGEPHSAWLHLRRPDRSGSAPEALPCGALSGATLPAGTLLPRRLSHSATLYGPLSPGQGLAEAVAPDPDSIGRPQHLIALAADCGRYLAALHAVALPESGAAALPRRMLDPDRVAPLERLGVPALAEAVSGLAADPCAAGDDVLVHGALDEYCLVSAPGAPPAHATVIGWEMAGRGSPLLDLAQLAARLAEGAILAATVPARLARLTAARALIEGYRASAPARPGLRRAALRDHVTVRIAEHVAFTVAQRGLPQEAAAELLRQAVPLVELAVSGELGGRVPDEHDA